MLTIILIVIAGLIVWCLAGLALALGLGKAVRIADHREFPWRYRTRNRV